MTLEAPGLPARRAAVEALMAVLSEGRPLDESWRDGGLAPRDAGFARALAYAALRHCGRLQEVLLGFLRQPPEGLAGVILLTGAAELIALKGAPHAAVASMVELAKSARGGARLAPLVNAVLRRVAEQGPEIFAGLDPKLDAPEWFWKRLVRVYGETAARAILAAHAAGAPLDLTARDPAEAGLWAERLGGVLTPTGTIRLKPSGALHALPGYSEGAWWAQDLAAALPARMLGDVKGLSVLDLCAAPGGKTMQLAAAGARVTALDASAPRLERLRENLARTGLKADVVCADARDWRPKQAFDAILIDAPCSASGVVRRNPDLPWLRDGTEINALAQAQHDLLRRALEWLRPGGKMVYAVCSLWPEEGPDQIRALLKARRGLRARPSPVIPAALRDAEGALRSLPHHGAEQGGLDGFYAVFIEKD